jgi:hypothetical protein
MIPLLLAFGFWQLAPSPLPSALSLLSFIIILHSLSQIVREMHFI